MAKVTLLLNFMAVLILSTACHELTHAWLADRFGDDTPRRAGRMSLNPFVHIHPVFTVLAPAVMFWMGGGFFSAAWTPVTPSKMRRPHVHGLLVALGGPASNLVLAAAAFLVLAVLILLSGGFGEGTSPRMLGVLNLFYMAVHLNLFLALFNFLPVPPLDGSAVVGFLLPEGLREGWAGLRRHSLILFVVLSATGVLGKVLHPATDAAREVVDFGIRIVNGLAHG